VPAGSASDELRSYPDALLRSPLDVREARARVIGGSAAGVAPALSEVRTGTTSEGGFASLITEQELGLGVILASLALALFWGAAHALTPGHGKAIVAAYLVGARGTPRHAAILGVTVTVTHTISVFALGLVTLALSQYLVPDQLYPWLNLVAGMLVVGVGVAVLRTRLHEWLHAYLGEHDHGHGHDHGHDHGRHGHEHANPSGRGLLGIGISGGIIPCPTALVVLLAAISLHRVGYGLVLIVAFSLGLALTVTSIGLVAVTARRAFGRFGLDGVLVKALPALSALIVLALGVVMTARALPQLA